MVGDDRAMVTTDFHIRMDPKLDQQVERESVLRRTSKNQLIIGILQRTLNPNANDEQTIFRRLDRVEKSLASLENAVRHIVQHDKVRHEQIGALETSVTQSVKSVETTLKSV